MAARAAPLYAITGGPCAGKTSLVEGIAAAGYAVVPEAGRVVIREQQDTDGRALPSVDQLAFARAMLSRDLAAYDRHRSAAAPVFFDRGIPDVAGYLALEGLPVPDDVRHAMRTRPYARVFICPPWPEIYVTDAERKQTPETAARTYEAMAATYTVLGYALVEVPRASLADRARFVLSAVGL